MCTVRPAGKVHDGVLLFPNPPLTCEMSAGRQKKLKYVECHGKSCLGRTFHCARLHLLGIAIQMSEAYTTVISAWIVKNTEKAGNLKLFR